MKRLSILAAVCAAVLALAGCGGGHSSPDSGGGRAVLTIKWPSRGRLIPAAANSIKATFTRGAQVVASQILARPTSGNQTTATFDNLKVGSLTLTASAFPNADGTGVAQAQGVTPVTIANGQTANVTLTMDSTIDHLELSPANPQLATGSSLALVVTAKDLAGNIVLLSPNKLQWSSSSSNVSVDSSGKVKAVVAGPATITVTDTESGKATNTVVTGTSSATEIVVGDFDLSAIRLYDAGSGAFKRDMVPNNGSGLDKPHDILVDQSGTLYVSADATNDVKRFDANGQFIDVFVANGAGGLDNAVGLAWAPDGNLLVASAWTNDVKKYDKNTGAYLGSFASGHGLNVPNQIIIGPDSNLYVASSGITSGVSSVLRFNATTGAFIDAFVPAGSGGLNKPYGLAFGPDGNLYVSSQPNTVKRYNGTTGAYIDDFVAAGSGNLSGPGAMTFAPDGRLYVASSIGGVRRYNATTGAFIDDFIPVGTGGIGAPSYMLFR